MKNSGYLVPFVAALLVTGVAFLLMDIAIMNLQGLNLLFEQ